MQDGGKNQSGGTRKTEINTGSTKVFYGTKYLPINYAPISYL